MATYTWEPKQDAVAYQPDPPVVPDPGVSSVRHMGLVRRFVSEVLQGEGSPVLSDDEWASLCLVGEGNQTDQVAISRIVLAAYALRNPVTDGAGTLRVGTEPESPDPSTSGLWIADPTGSTVSDVEPWGPADPTEGPLIPAGFAAKDDRLWEPIVFDPGATVPVDLGPTAEVAVTAWTLAPTDPGPDGTSEPTTSYERSRRVRPGRPRWSVKATSSVHQAYAKAPLSRLTDQQRGRLIVATSWVFNIGAIILLFVAWQLWGTAITQHHTQTALKGQFESKIHHPVTKPAPGFTLLPASTRIPDPPDGSPMAHLQIPKIGLDEIVVSGTDEGDLAKGPGHYLGTAVPGQAGNVAIAGHRTTHGAPFNRLAELSAGDPIYLTTASGQLLTYIVSATPVAVSPRDVTVLNNFGDNRLTLTTCNPEYSAVQRLIVVAAYLPPGATRPTPIAKGIGKTYALAPAETSGWNTTLLPLVALEVLALVGLGLTYRRLSNIYGKGTRWIILGPIWIALLIALFETLTNFLPAAV